MRMNPEEYETLRLFLYNHNGSMGPNPNTEGAGGLGGLYDTYARLVEARMEALAKEFEAKAKEAEEYYGGGDWDGIPAPVLIWSLAAGATRESLRKKS